MLHEEQIEHYYREGYLVVEGLVSPQTVEQVITTAQSLGEYRDGGGWSPRIFDHQNPTQDASLHAILWEPSVIEAVKDLLASEPRVYYGMLAVVPAHGGTGLPWHQDNQYTHLLGGALNTFVALSEITPERANLWVSPKSHLWGVQPARKSDLYEGVHREAVVAPDNGFCLPTLRPGDACIFDRSTYHRSLQNTTPRHRFAYAAQYQADHTRQAATGKRDPLRMRARDLRPHP